MKTVFYNKNASFELTDDEFKKALVEFDKGRRVYIQRLKISLSPLYLWAGEKQKTDDEIIGEIISKEIKKI